MTFYTSLSGLQAAQTDMSTISHNLANVSTTGFKKSRTEFADVIASNLATDPKKMVGQGTVVKATTQDFSEGSLTTTSSSLDLAISGDGFFAVKTPGAASVYTRNGEFSVDANHNVVDAQGSFLQAYPVDANGNVTATGTDGMTNVQIPEISGTPVATSDVALSVKLSSNAVVPTATFDRTSAASYNNSSTTTIYDASGNAQTMTNYYVRTSAASATDGSSTWSVYSYVGDKQLTVGGSATPVTATFDSSGVLTSPTTATTFDAFTPAGTSTTQTVALNLAGSDQAGTSFSVASKTQDGKSVGQLSGVTVDDSGIITASYSNGDALKLGKVALANFANPEGLRQLGSSYWASTGISGTATTGTAGNNGLGTVMSGTIESSNVDITEELVALIAAQRNFQANSKALDTQNQITETIFNMRS